MPIPTAAAVFVAAHLLLAGGLGAGVAPAAAAVVHDEADDGELSDVASSPTFLRLDFGSNVVRGSTVGPSATHDEDKDFFTARVPEPWSLVRMDLIGYQQDAPPGDQGALLAVEPGSRFTDPVAGTRMIGAALVGVRPGRMVGDDLLGPLGREIVYWERGFTPPLPAADYTFWYQQQTGATEYAFDLVVAPLPGSLPALATAIGGLGWLWTRRRRSPLSRGAVA